MIKIKKYIVLSSASFLLSCNYHEKSNKIKIVSENPSDLQNILDVSKFKPQNVKFQHIYIDNSKGILAGPSDSFIQAEMLYDKEKIDSLKNTMSNSESDSQITNIDVFLNNWFDSKTSDKLVKDQKELRVYNDFLFNTSGNIVILEDKILYRK
ncbi:hypothetical protein [Chryseobacterium foetidum]|uniref:hypothetical protein n=1 Tax=Chryseobacterium foetidum TaxID=2951057 RepID=UPI0021C8F943|nr:hypothetical protein [Chryseobacterium foetidum]